MEKIKKDYNFNIVLVIISAFFVFNNALYCSADTLRIPVGDNGTSKRILEAINSKPASFTHIVQNVFKDKGYIVDGTSLGRGWRCIIFKATEIATSKVVAIKIADPYGDSVPDMCWAYCWSMKNQVEFWKQRGIFNHNFPALIQLYNAGFIAKAEMRKYTDSPDLLARLDWDYHYQILEFVDGESVEKLLSSNFFTNKDVIDKLVEFIYGINALHEARLVHGELLSKNIMVDKNMNFKACDLDPLNIAYGDKKQKDIEYLYSVVRQILNQAYGTILDSFFKQWTSDYVVEQGLRSFGDALIAINSPSIRIDKGTRNEL